MELEPLLLDLFCGAGGAAKGYSDVGFKVVGVDLEPQPHYPYTFVQGDALNALDTLVMAGQVGGYYFDDFAAIHASPPCQAYSISKSTNSAVDKYPRLIGALREQLRMTAKPYVIENVEGAKSDMETPVTLCGSHFNLTAWWDGYGLVGLRRHRLFESNFFIPDPGPHDHSLKAVPVWGHGPGGKMTHRLWPVRKGGAKAARDVMDIGWMTRDEINEAIPPAYTRYVGSELMRYLALPLAA